MSTSRLNRPAPRNPVALPARQRRAGAHGPSRKARRQMERRAFQRALGALDALP